MANIRQNLFFAFIYNAAGVPIAAGVLYPLLRHPAVADHRGGGDVAVVGQRHRQRAAAAENRYIIRIQPSLSRPGFLLIFRHGRVTMALGSTRKNA